MKVSHSPAGPFARFDDPDLIAHTGLVPTIRLTERCGLPRLVAKKVKLTGARNGAGTAADAKALSIVGGVIVGADSIEDLDVHRHGGLSRLFGGVRAPFTLGSLLRAFTWGHVRQPESAVRAFTCHRAAHTGLVPTTDEVVFVDIDSKVKQVYGPAKQGASFGYTKQRGLHFQIVTVKTATCAPVIVETPHRTATRQSPLPSSRRNTQNPPDTRDHNSRGGSRVTRSTEAPPASTHPSTTGSGNRSSLCPQLGSPPHAV